MLGALAHLLTWFVRDPISCCLPQVFGVVGENWKFLAGDWEVERDVTRWPEKMSLSM
jgi:hypothetical protein